MKTQSWNAGKVLIVKIVVVKDTLEGKIVNKKHHKAWTLFIISQGNTTPPSKKPLCNLVGYQFHYP